MNSVVPLNGQNFPVSEAIRAFGSALEDLAPEAKERIMFAATVLAGAALIVWACKS